MSDYWARVDRMRKAHGSLPYGPACEQVLAQMMDFDHVIEVLADDDGTTRDVIDRNDLSGPSLYDDVVGDTFHGNPPRQDRWTLLDGYSGQARYAGPIMHESEYIGGAMARDILATPGVYVAVVAYYSPEDDEEDDEADDDGVGGWAVARLDN